MTRLLLPFLGTVCNTYTSNTFDIQQLNSFKYRNSGARLLDHLISCYMAANAW